MLGDLEARTCILAQQAGVTGEGDGAADLEHIGCLAAAAHQRGRGYQ